MPGCALAHAGRLAVCHVALKGAAAEHAARVNKALVAFMACLMIAAAAWSAAANLHRFAR